MVGNLRRTAAVSRWCWADDMAWPNMSMSELLAQPPSRPEGASVYGYFFAGLTAMVGFWATLSLNIPDFSRFAKSQKDQIVGQVIGLPLTMFFFAALGVVLTAASETLVGETVADPVRLIGYIDSPFWVVLAMLLIIIATISTNTASNIVSPTNDFQNIAPKLINQTRGVLMTGAVGVLLMGYDLLQKAGVIPPGVSLEQMYSNWLLGYSSLLGPIAGIMAVDYFLIKKQRLDVPSLYMDNHAYPAVNIAGFIAFGVPVALTLLSLLTGTMNWFYDYGWFTGSALGAIVYYVASQVLASSPQAGPAPIMANEATEQR